MKATPGYGLVQVEINKEDMARLHRLLSGIREGVPKALSAALNDTMRTVKAKMSRDIRERVVIKKKDIDPYLAGKRATKEKLAAGIVLSKSERLPLKYFGARQTHSGVTYQIGKEKGRSVLAHAFGPAIVATWPAVDLHGQVVQRTGLFGVPTRGRYAPSGMYAGQRREKLSAALRGPSPWGVFVKQKLLGPTRGEATLLLHKNTRRKVQWLLSKNESEKEQAAREMTPGMEEA